MFVNPSELFKSTSLFFGVPAHGFIRKNYYVHKCKVSKNEKEAISVAVVVISVVLRHCFRYWILVF